jgi:hypothetical protein
MKGKEESQFQPLKAAVLLSIPLMIFMVIMMGDSYSPAILRKLQIPAAILVGCFILYVLWKGKSYRKGVGHVPSSFSGEVELLESKLRERLEELEQAYRRQTTAPPMPSGLTLILDNVERTAAMDKKELSYLKVVRARDHEIQNRLAQAFGSQDNRSVPISLHSDLQWFATSVQSASEELKRYAGEVRAKGGVYRIRASEMKGCSAQLLIFTAAGGVLIWKFYEARDWHFWTGLALIVCVALEVVMLILMHNEPA